MNGFQEFFALQQDPLKDATGSARACGAAASPIRLDLRKLRCSTLLPCYEGRAKRGAQLPCFSQQHKISTQSPYMSDGVAGAHPALQGLSARRGLNCYATKRYYFPRR
jgi:hypothetical protein